MALPTNVQEHDQVSVINSLSKTEVEGIQEPEHDFSKFTGVLRLYYMTICTITNGKFTIGLYRIVA